MATGKPKINVSLPTLGVAGTTNPPANPPGAGFFGGNPAGGGGLFPQPVTQPQAGGLFGPKPMTGLPTGGLVQGHPPVPTLFAPGGQQLQ